MASITASQEVIFQHLNQKEQILVAHISCSWYTYIYITKLAAPAWNGVHIVPL